MTTALIILGALALLVLILGARLLAHEACLPEPGSEEEILERNAWCLLHSKEGTPEELERRWNQEMRLRRVDAWDDRVLSNIKRMEKQVKRITRRE